MGGQTDHKQNNQVYSVLEGKAAKVKNKAEERGMPREGRCGSEKVIKEAFPEKVTFGQNLNGS